MQGLEAVVTRYCDAFPEQMSALLDLLRYGKLSTGKQNSVAKSLQGELHRMSGAAMCMGFDGLGAEFRNIEKDLQRIEKMPPMQGGAALEVIETHLSQVANMASQIRPENSKVVVRTRAFSAAEPENRDDTSLAGPRRRILARQRVLFADDDAFVRELMVETLHEMGITDIMAVSSGLEVLGALRTFRPTLIMTDWCMEPVSGLELLQCIRTGGTPLPKDVPVIFFTAQKEQKHVVQALKHGVDQFLVKPVLPSVIERAVLMMVERQFSGAGVA